MPKVSAPNRAGNPRRCLVTGATGYVGGRLVPELPSAGYRARLMARTPDKLLHPALVRRVEVATAVAEVRVCSRASASHRASPKSSTSTARGS